MTDPGYVYILTNPSFREDWVKIGKSSRPVDIRSKELDNTAVPLPFEIYATLKTAKYEIVEKKIHKAIDRLTTLRIRRTREFFNIEPAKALEILRDEAEVLDDAEIVLYKDNKPIPTSPAAKPAEPETKKQEKTKKKEKPAKPVVAVPVPAGSGIVVTFKDGSTLVSKSTTETFIAAIKAAGVAEVQSLGLIVGGIPLVADKVNEKYSSEHKEIAPGKYVVTHSSSATKVRTLKRISDALNLGWDIKE